MICCFGPCNQRPAPKGITVCAGFRPGSILPRVVPFTISLEQVHKLHVICPASSQARPLTSVASAAKLLNFMQPRHAGMLAARLLAIQQYPVTSCGRHLQHLWSPSSAAIQAMQMRTSSAASLNLHPQQ